MKCYLRVTKVYIYTYSNDYNFVDNKMIFYHIKYEIVYEIRK